VIYTTAGTTNDEREEAAPAKRPRTTAGEKLKKCTASVVQIGPFSALEFAR
jgi:hypothetical protein